MISSECCRTGAGLEIELRFALIAYRDVGDTDAIVVHDFTPDPAQLQDQVRKTCSTLWSLWRAEVHNAGVRNPVSQVSSLQATGGGDLPEDILPALHAAATQLSWASRARFALLIADAPCHGRDCHYGFHDSYPDVSFGTIEGRASSKTDVPLS
jgi:hypothetical protein